VRIADRTSEIVVFAARVFRSKALLGTLGVATDLEHQEPRGYDLATLSAPTENAPCVLGVHAKEVPPPCQSPRNLPC
jgi:hypothetical protein